MKKILFAIIFLLPALVPDSSAHASQVRKAGFALQNTGGAAADVVIGLFNPDGSSALQINLSIEPYGSSLIDPDQLAGLPAGWSGSAVVTSAAPVVGAGWAETFSKYGDTEGIGWFNLPGDNGLLPFIALFRIQVPLVRIDPIGGSGFELWIQNLGTIAATVNVTYFPLEGGGSSTSSCPALPPGASLEAVSACSPGPPAAFSGSAVVTSVQPMGVVADLANQDGMTECLYNGLAVGHQSLFFPIVLNNSQGWNSRVAVQNEGSSPGSGSFDYRADCSDGCAGEPPLASPSIAPDSGYVFTPVASLFSGYGQFTSAVEPFGGVAEVWNSSAGVAYCYNGGGTVFPAPLESTWLISHADSSSRIVVKNTSQTAGGSIRISWLGLAGNQTVDLAVNGKQEITPAVPAGWSGSGVVRTTGPAMPLVIIVRNAQYGGRDLGAYQAVGEGSGSSRLYVPHVQKAVPFLPNIWRFYNPAILEGRKTGE